MFSKTLIIQFLNTIEKAIPIWKEQIENGDCSYENIKKINKIVEIDIDPMISIDEFSEKENEKKSTIRMRLFRRNIKANRKPKYKLSELSK